MTDLSDPAYFDAVIFDLDGVLTDSAKVHAAAWKALFDDYLRERSARYGEAFRPFSVEEDYRSFVDGKPRYDGVRSFLLSREIQLSNGDPTDEPGQETVCGLGNRKDRLFTDILVQKGVEVFESTVRLVRQLKASGVRCGVASSSKNCQRVLEIAAIDDLFEARVDGVVSAELGLKGKPAPDIFLKCAELLRATPRRTVVVEDALSGVQAGRAGRFGLVIGIDRMNLGDELRRDGADVVVTDLLNVSIGIVNAWYRAKNGLSDACPCNVAVPNKEAR